MDRQQIRQQFDQFVVPNYTRKDVILVRGEGSRVWDAEGRSYLDLFPGWGCDGLGHCHPRVVQALREQAGTLIHVANDYYNALQGKLAMLIATHSFGGKCFFCNSGAEANEGAIKFARIVGGPGRSKIVTVHNSFHGRTLAAITATGQEKYHQGIGPLSPGFEYVPFNDIDAMAQAVDETTCAVMIELIQGEGGVNVAEEAYVAQLRELCDQRGALLIVDEVQTGCGRTGEYFAHRLYELRPDLMTLAKALGGGTAIGAIEARPDIADAIKPGLHASTFGGNPLACAAAIAVFEAIEAEGLLDHTQTMGKHLRDGLHHLADATGLIQEVRGRGLMVGCDLKFPGADVVKECLANGLLINCTHDTVVRFLPAMTVTQDELDEGLAIFGKALEARAG